MSSNEKCICYDILLASILHAFIRYVILGLSYRLGTNQLSENDYLLTRMH